MKGEAVLAIFARYPELGKVKTRLASGVGREAALRIYTKMLRAQIAEHRHRGYDFVAFVTPPEKVGRFAQEYGVRAIDQRGADLGLRMANCFIRLLSEYEKVAIVGSDIPRLRTRHVRTAFERLVDHDVSLGPAPDGGYYLIAAKAVPDVFSNMPWSTPSVFGKTIHRLKDQSKKVFLLPEERDVDTPEDLDVV